jgi:hypothetical protein
MPATMFIQGDPKEDGEGNDLHLCRQKQVERPAKKCLLATTMCAVIGNYFIALVFGCILDGTPCVADQIGDE